ncbi:MAG: site-specific integrase [Pseudomonadota bacterium]
MTEHQHKRSLKDDISRLKGLLPFVGGIPIDRLHMGTLQPWVEHRRATGASVTTINHGLQVVRRILNLASGEWMDENGMTWLHVAPRIRFLPKSPTRQPYPLDWDEQSRLIHELPQHLAEMTLFAANTGCRDSEICGLRWDWEVPVPQLSTSVFLVPGNNVKNGDERLVVLNRVASSVVSARRGQDRRFVFTFDGKPIARMNNSAWRKARERAGLPQVRVHDLKHTFGRRLRAAGVSFEDRQDLLGHRSGRITTHYSAAELGRLLDAANSVCDRGKSRPELVVLKGVSGQIPAKSPQSIGTERRQIG